MNAKLYYHATAGTALASLTEAGVVKNATVNMSASLADVTTRANSGWKAQRAALREMTLDFDFPHKIVNGVKDAGFEAFRNAFINGTTLELAALTGNKSAADTEGPKGTFTISQFNRGEQLEEAITYNVTAVLQDYDQWVDNETSLSV
jgi:acetylornithine/succinyldiaminopimelate/putrescine aminotransferase